MNIQPNSPDGPSPALPFDPTRKARDIVEPRVIRLEFLSPRSLYDYSQRMNLILQYNLDPAEVAALDSEIRAFLATHGVEVSLASLERVVEQDVYSEVYRINRALAEDEGHHETCVSDGKTVWIHDQIEHVGGECSRLYDMLHVGCGHLFQWAAGRESGLSFYGDEAWEMASKFFLKAPEPEIQRVWRYEREAAQLASGNLARILEQGRFSSRFREAFACMFNDYAATDLEYITAFYRTGEVRSIFDQWQRGAAVIPSIQSDFRIQPIRRSNRCIPLLSKRQS